MAQCAYCKAETELHFANVPVCIKCGDARSPEQTRASLLQNIADATMRAEAASEAFQKVVADIPSDIPHPEPLRRMHRYDTKGRRIETRSQLAVLGTDRKTTAYDDHGEPIKENFEHESREYGIDDEGRFSDNPTRETVNRWEARFHYDYDAHGNWVRKVVEGRDGTK